MSTDLNLAKELFSRYEEYKETALTHRRFKHIDILPLINRLKEASVFTVTQAGSSEQGERNISF